MVRLVVVLAVFTACCGDEPDPHAWSDCNGWPPVNTTPLEDCQVACETPPTFTSPTPCGGYSFNWHGINGVCAVESDYDPIGKAVRVWVEFHECM